MPIRRIILGLDSSTSNRLAIEQAVAMADRLRAELVAVFVKDQDLLSFSGLPFAVEVGATSGTARELRGETLARQLALQAEELRRSLERQARIHRLSWRFLTCRGHMLHELAALAVEGDLIALVPESASNPILEAADWRVTMARLDRHPLVFIRRVRHPRLGAVLIDTDATRAEIHRGLELLELVERPRSLLGIVVGCATLPKEREQMIVDALSQTQLPAHLECLRCERWSEVRILLGSRRVSSLVIAGGELIAKGDFGRFLRETRFPVYLCRKTEEEAPSADSDSEE